MIQMGLIIQALIHVQAPNWQKKPYDTPLILEVFTNLTAYKNKQFHHVIFFL